MFISALTKSLAVTAASSVALLLFLPTMLLSKESESDGKTSCNSLQKLAQSRVVKRYLQER